MSRQRGFTLIEVLVALVIVALGMSALLETLGSAADTATWLRDKTFAQWIAFNQLEQTLRLSGSRCPPTGTTDGELDYRRPPLALAPGVSATWASPVCSGLMCKVEPADTSTIDEKGWMATVTGGIGDAVSPPQLQSLYPDPALPGSSSSARPPASRRPPAPPRPSSHPPAPNRRRPRRRRHAMSPRAPAQPRLHAHRTDGGAVHHCHHLCRGLRRHQPGSANHEQLKEHQARLSEVQNAVRVMVQDFSELAARPIRDQLGQNWLACITTQSASSAWRHSTGRGSQCAGSAPGGAG